MKISWKNIENWRSWKMRFFWGGHFEFFKSAILIFFCFISVKNPAHLYEVLFFSALWMVFPESWKRSCLNFYAHDCNFSIIKMHIKQNSNFIAKFWSLLDLFSSLQKFTYGIYVKKFWLQYPYRNATLVSTPDIDTKFWLHTNCTSTY